VDCSGLSAAGEGALILVVIVIAAFAVFGLFVAVVAGTGYVQRVVQRHMHVLHKSQLAHSFIVADLESADDGVEEARRALGINRDGTSISSTGGGDGSGISGTSGGGSGMIRDEIDVESQVVGVAGSTPMRRTLLNGYQRVSNPLVDDDEDTAMGSIELSSRRTRGASPTPSMPSDAADSGALPVAMAVNNPDPEAPSAPVMSAYQYRELARLGLV